MSAAPGAPASRPTHASEEGLLLGTAAYMSPEQARGKAVDKRTDIWSFGCVLYEMLTGRQAFSGDTVTDVLAAVIEHQPNWHALPASTPTRIRELLQRCLEKDPNERLRDMGDAVSELERALQAATRSRPSIGRHFRSWSARVRWSLAATTVLAAAVTISTSPSGLLWPAAPAAAPVVTQLTSYPGSESQPTFSPDGDRVAFSWDGEQEDNRDIYVKLVGPGPPWRLTTDPADDVRPQWSPDGKWIAFYRDSEVSSIRGVYVVPPMGGVERRIGDARVGLAWMPDSKGLILVKQVGLSALSSLVLVSPEGDSLRLTAPPNQELDRSPAVAPDGHALAFTRSRLGDFVLEISAEEPGAPLIDIRPPEGFGGTSSWSADSRELVFSSGYNPENSVLWRVPASEGARPVRLPFVEEGASYPAVAPRGNRLAFTRLLREINIWALDVDRLGVAERPASRVFDSSKSEICPQFSPGGRRVAFESNRSGTDEIWVCQADGTQCVQLTSFQGQHAGSPSWSPRGDVIAFDVFGREKGIYVVSPDGGRPQRLSDKGQMDVQSPAAQLARIPTPGWLSMPLDLASGQWDRRSEKV